MLTMALENLNRLRCNVFEQSADSLVGYMFQQGQLRLIEALLLLMANNAVQLLADAGRGVDRIEGNRFLGW